MTANSAAPFGFLNVEWVDQAPDGKVDTAAEVVQAFLNEKNWNFSELSPEQLKELIDYLSGVLANGANLPPGEQKKLDELVSTLVGIYAEWNTELASSNTMQHQDAINAYFTAKTLSALPAGTLPPSLMASVNANQSFVEHAYAASCFLDKGSPPIDPSNPEKSIELTREFIQHVTELERINPQYAKDHGLTELKNRFAALLAVYDKTMEGISNLPPDTPIGEIESKKLAAVNQFVKDASVIYCDYFQGSGLAPTHPAVKNELAVRSSANVFQQNDLGKNWNITDVDRPTDYSITGLQNYRDNYLTALKAQMEASGNQLAVGHIQALIDLVSQEISSLKAPATGVQIPMSMRMIRFSIAIASVDTATTRGLISKARSSNDEALMRQYENQLSMLESLVKSLMEMSKKIEENYTPSLGQVGR